ncbi:hypothetical protein BSKO_08889 [Bryopsis sp. KO-2023]|nr:hypothetical protein BSKO_08889 [Bryopsis sp. KO-2023]
MGTDDSHDLPVVTKSVSLGPAIFGGLRQLWQKTEWADISITLRTETETASFRLHRVVLLSSGYFSGRFNGDWDDSSSGDISPGDPWIDAASFETTLRGLYGHQVHITEDNVYGLLATASYLQVEDMTEKCTSFIAAMLRTKDFQGLAQCYDFLSGRHCAGMERIKGNLIRTLGFRASDVVKEEILAIPTFVLKSLFKSGSLWFNNELERGSFVLELIHAIDKKGFSQASSEGCSDDLHGGVVLETDAISKKEALIDVLRNSVNYMFIPPGHAMELCTKIKVTCGSSFLQVIKDQLFQREMFYGSLRQRQVKDPTVAKAPPLNNEKWFRFGVEFNGVDKTSSGEKKYSRKVYYAGSTWFLGLCYEYPGIDGDHLKSEDVKGWYGAHLHRRRPKDEFDIAFCDKRDWVEVQYKLDLGSLMVNGKNSFDTQMGIGWSHLFLASDLHSFLSRNGVLRVQVSLRMVS